MDPRKITDSFTEALRRSQTPDWVVGAYLVLRERKVIHSSPHLPDDEAINFMFDIGIDFNEIEDRRIAHLPANIPKIEEVIAYHPSIEDLAEGILKQLDPFSATCVDVLKPGTYIVMLDVNCCSKPVAAYQCLIAGYSFDHQDFIRNIFRPFINCLDATGVKTTICHTRISPTGKISNSMPGIPSVKFCIASPSTTQ